MSVPIDQCLHVHAVQVPCATIRQPRVSGASLSTFCNALHRSSRRHLRSHATSCWKQQPSMHSSCSVAGCAACICRYIATDGRSRFSSQQCGSHLALARCYGPAEGAGQGWSDMVTHLGFHSSFAHVSHLDAEFPLRLNTNI